MLHTDTLLLPDDARWLCNGILHIQFIVFE